jgi:hypothetical protein
MSDQPFILCPCCGATIEIEARIVQAELPLGPIALADKKKLDDSDGEIAKITADRPTDRNLLSLSLTERDRERPTDRSDAVASCEEDLIRSLQKIIGERDWNLNSKEWRSYCHGFPRALAYAIEDWKMRTPHQQRAIKNRAAWLTDRYKRAGGQTIQARKSA